MSLRVVFLGTGGSVPTRERGLPTVVIQRGGEQIMFDCGEGAQRQMVKAGCGFHRKMKVFVTHMHGDHVLGLPGLLQTMALLDRKKKLELYGPRGLRRFLDCIRKTVQFVLTFEVEVHEIENAGVVCEEKDYVVEAAWADHVIPSLAYALTEKPRPGRFYPEKARAVGVPEGPLWSRLQQGHEARSADGKIVKPQQVIGSSRIGRKVAYSGDTRPFKGMVKLASRADLLIHEATLDDTLKDRASEDGHSTPAQAARIAKKARVKLLVLTHISARYSDASILLKQARKTFKQIDAAEDFKVLDLPLQKD